MFTDTTSRRAIAAIEGELADLKTLVAASNGRIAALTQRLAALGDDAARLTGSGGNLEQMSHRIDEAVAAEDRHAEAFNELGQRVSAVERAATEHHMDRKRLETTVEQLRRQAAVDNAEMRANYAALAEIVTRDRSTSVNLDDGALQF